MSKKKLKVGVLFGGRSAEHEVSLVSAFSVIKNLDYKKYEAVPIGITKKGEWYAGPQVLDLLKSGKSIPKLLQVILPAEPGRELLKNQNTKIKIQKLSLDVVFPVLHGTFGEDGTVQGLLELSGIPYVGCGVLGSAVGMDKIAQKMIFQAVGIPTPNFLYIRLSEYKKNSQKFIKECQTKLRLPCFVKPANLGSSVGISKAHNIKELKLAITLAAKYDERIIVEQNIEKALEIECAVLGNNNPHASVLGQIVASNEFYDYDAKYVNGKSQAIIPAPLPKRISTLIQKLAVQAFVALDLAGMSRVDFLVSRDLKHIYLNEVNTIPGFTSISMYPKLWEVSGLLYPQLLSRLIQLAMERHAARAKLNTSFKPKKLWYQ